MKNISTFQGLPISTVTIIIKIYVDTERTTKILVVGDRRLAINNDQKMLVRNWVDDNPCIRLEALKLKLQINLNIMY